MVVLGGCAVVCFNKLIIYMSASSDFSLENWLGSCQRRILRLLWRMDHRSCLGMVRIRPGAWGHS